MGDNESDKLDLESANGNLNRVKWCPMQSLHHLNLNWQLCVDLKGCVSGTIPHPPQCRLPKIRRVPLQGPHYLGPDLIRNHFCCNHIRQGCAVRISGCWAEGQLRCSCLPKGPHNFHLTGPAHYPDPLLAPAPQFPFPFSACKPRPCLSCSRRRDRIDLGFFRSLDKGWWVG